MINRMYLSAIVTEAVTFFSLKHFSELDIAGLVIGMGELDAIYLRTSSLPSELEDSWKNIIASLKNAIADKWFLCIVGIGHHQLVHLPLAILTLSRVFSQYQKPIISFI